MPTRWPTPLDHLRLIEELSAWLSVRGGIISVFIIANPASTIIGAPLSTTLFGTNLFGLAGWQTMFIVEALPAVLLGFAALYVLCDSPAQAKWLTEREREVLLALVAPGWTQEHPHLVEGRTHELAGVALRPALCGDAVRDTQNPRVPSTTAEPRTHLSLIRLSGLI